MNSSVPNTEISNVEASLNAALEAQRNDFLKEGEVTAESRIDRLDRSIDIVLKYQDQLVDAMNADFSCRPREITLLTDIAPSVMALKHAKKHVKKWMKPEKRPTVFPMNIMGGRSRIEYQPLGVAGVISPWNFPATLTFGPLAGALSAGNRVMIKPSEFTPETSELLKTMMDEAFAAEEVAVFPGGPDVGVAFSQLPLDHLLFTGATSVARHIMTAAAQNLVPVTLELGGKSPVVISRSADLEKSIERIVLGKLINAGQICLAPDYLIVPEEKLAEVISIATKIASDMYPTIIDNKEYTSVINERHFKRLISYLEDAEKAGAKITSVNPANEDFSQQPEGSHKLPLTLVSSPSDDSKVLQEEIFGPILPIKTYKGYSEIIDYINSRPRPLAAYYFGDDKGELNELTKRTTSGSMCINDVVFQNSQEDLPFGGVGPSGMGAYHGIEGFRTFSHAKSIYTQTNFNFAKIAGIIPPYSSKTESTIKMQVKK